MSNPDLITAPSRSPHPSDVSLNDVGIWMAAIVGGMVFMVSIWKAIVWAVNIINKPVINKLEKQELRIQHLEEGHKSIKDEVNALRSEMKDGFKSLSDMLSQQIAELRIVLLNKK